MIRYKIFEKYSEIAHFCTIRQGGTSVGNYASFNLSPFTGDDMNAVTANKSKLGEWLGIDSDRIIIPFQTHETEVKEIGRSFLHSTDEEKRKYLEGVDAIFTNVPNICICISTADCVPLLFYDPTKQVVAAAHAGWRGTCGKIAEKIISALIEAYHSNPSDILVTIGPSISAKMYEVGQKVVNDFEVAGFEISEIVERRNESLYLDLWKANEQLLRKAGIEKQNIEVAGICTFTEHERFFSARRLGIKSGRMLSGIMLKNKLT